MEIVLLVLMFVGAWFVGTLIRAAFTGAGVQDAKYSDPAQDPRPREDVALLGIDTEALWEELADAGYEHIKWEQRAKEAPWGLLRKDAQERAAYHDRLADQAFALVMEAEAAQHFTGWASMTSEQRTSAQRAYQGRVDEGKAKVRARLADAEADWPSSTRTGV